MVASSLPVPPAARYRARLQAFKASRTASSLLRVGPIDASRWAARALATSPPGCPPSPSATATTRGVPSGKTRLCGFSVTVAHSVHGPTTRLSSFRPRSSPGWLSALTATYDMERHRLPAPAHRRRPGPGPADTPTRVLAAESLSREMDPHETSCPGHPAS